MPKDNQKTVLTVDDNELLRYSIVRMLIDAGYKVVEAANGNQALECAARLPDIITLDVQLPDIDGFEVCKRLKADPQTRHIPILHISSTFIDPEYRVRGLKGGADAYLTEPIDRAELVATIEALLRIKSAEKDALKKVEVADSVRKEVQQVNRRLEERVGERTVQLENKTAEIRQLNIQLMKLQDQERRRIARELHDSTGQLLALLNLNLAHLSRAADAMPPEAKKLVTESAAITEELTSQLRTVSYLLHPPLIDDLGLAAALEWYVQGFADRSHIAIKLEIAPDFGRLEPDAEIAIFRIIQECLTNIHKHSGSNSAIVRVARDDRRVKFEVSDNGTKFTGGNPTVVPGTGVLGMRERVRQLGGALSIDFTEAGTLVTGDLPLAAASAG